MNESSGRPPFSYELSYDAESDAVVLVWNDSATPAVYAQALSEGLELLVEHSSCRWLEDRRLLGDLDEESHAWSRDTWFPRAILRGFKYCAIVLPELPLDSLTIEQILEMLELEMYTDYFDNLEDAIHWLKNPLA